MIRYFTNPALKNLLEKSREEVKFQESLFELAIISDYNKQQANIHSGILDVVKYRLFHPSNYVIFLSFYSIEELLLIDDFGILSLYGTECIQLPFSLAELKKLIIHCRSKELFIPKEKWLVFSENASKRLVNDKLGLLKHNNRLELSSFITIPLGGSCRAFYVNPTVYTTTIETQLLTVKEFIQTELSELIEIGGIGKNSNDSYLRNVYEFIVILKKIRNFSFSSEKSVAPLLKLIDSLDDIFDKIKNI